MTTTTPPTWMDTLRSFFTPMHSWSVYTDASWRAAILPDTLSKKQARPSSLPAGPTSQTRYLSNGLRCRTRGALRTTPSAWSRHQGGIYLADAITKNREIGTLSHSPIPTLQTHNIVLHDLLMVANPLTSWR